MKLRSRLSPAIALLAIFMSSLVNAQQARPAIPPMYKASPLEIAYLPKYCYHQYVDGALSGPKFSIPAEYCGYEMNHFCPALVFIVQATQVSRPLSERRGSVNHAIEEVNYTIRGMKPGCYIAQDVKRAMDRARSLSAIIK